MLRSIGKQSGESVESVRRRKGRLQWEGFAEKESFKPGVEEWRGNGWWVVSWWNWWSATQRTGWCKSGEISVWLTKVDNPLGQPLSRSSLVFLLVLDPELHTPYISSPSHHHLFAAHAHTNVACSAAKPMLCHLYLVSQLLTWESVF